MNQYYISVKEKFDDLVEISLIGKSKYVQMIYIEKVERDQQEIDEYEQEINTKFTKRTPLLT